VTEYGNDMRKSELIHRYLDGDASPRERAAFLREMEADPALKAEYEGLARALRVVAESRRKAAPLHFTAEVMKRLPQAKPQPVSARLRDFFLRARIARWNMASALAVALLAVIVVSLAMNLSRQGMRPTVASGQKQVVVERLYYYAPAARRVAIAGTFNKWAVDADKLTRRDGGMWTIDVSLKPGVYTYMFVVDGASWVTDPKADSYRYDGFGYKDSVLKVGT
jgi:anti-sigma factor RsiW